MFLQAVHGVCEGLDALADLVGWNGLIAQANVVSRFAGGREKNVTGLDEYTVLSGLARERLRGNMIRQLHPA